MVVVVAFSSLEWTSNALHILKSVIRIECPSIV
jgi:hypothetical protein